MDSFYSWRHYGERGKSSKMTRGPAHIKGHMVVFQFICALAGQRRTLGILDLFPQREKISKMTHGPTHVKGWVLSWCPQWIIEGHMVYVENSTVEAWNFGGKVGIFPLFKIDKVLKWITSPQPIRWFHVLKNEIGIVGQWRKMRIWAATPFPIRVCHMFMVKKSRWAGEAKWEIVLFLPNVLKWVFFPRPFISQILPSVGSNFKTDRGK